MAMSDLETFISRQTSGNTATSGEVFHGLQARGGSLSSSKESCCSATGSVQNIGRGSRCSDTFMQILHPGALT